MKRAPYGLVLVLVLVTSLSASGCGKRPPNHYYLLQPHGSHSPSAAGDGIDIGVKAIHVDPPYDGDRIVYRIGEDSPQVGFYGYHRWAAPLSRMLPGVVAAALNGAAGVGSIEPVVPGSDYGAYISGRVMRFEEVDLPEGQRARISFSLKLSAKDGTELWSNVFSGETSLETDNVSEIVDAMKSLLDELLKEALSDLETALSSRP